MTIKSMVKLISKYRTIQIIEKDVDKSCNNFDEDGCAFCSCSECEKYEPANKKVERKLFLGELKDMPFPFLDYEIFEVGVTTYHPHKGRAYTEPLLEIFVKGENFT